MFATQSDSDMVECPYDKTHRMLRKRLQSHLLKCRLNYPDKEFQKCPFNQTHLIPEPEFVIHVTQCPDRKLIAQYKYDAPEPKMEEELLVKHDPIECEENWDDTEVEDYNPQKYIATANVLRRPYIVKPSERKAFNKEQRKRLGDYDSNDEAEAEQKGNFKLKRAHCSDDDDAGSVGHVRQCPPTPPPLTGRDCQRSKYRPRTRSRSRSPEMYRHAESFRNRSLAYQRHYSPKPEARKQRSPTPDYVDLDDDPYYNGGTSSSREDSASVSSSNSRTMHYDYTDNYDAGTTRLYPRPQGMYGSPMRGNNRGRSHLGPIPGRNDTSYYRY